MVADGSTPLQLCTTIQVKDGTYGAIGVKRDLSLALRRQLWSAMALYGIRPQNTDNLR